MSSVKAMVLAREEVLSRPMNSLPMVGTTTRMAWGRTIRRMDMMRVMPMEEAASIWPRSTERIPPRTISVM